MAIFFFIFEKLYNSLFLLFYFNFSNADDILKLFKSGRNVIYGIPNKKRLFIQAIRQGSVEVTIGNFSLNIWEIYKHFTKYEKSLREIDKQTKRLELESKQSDVDRKKNEKELHQLKIQKEKIEIIFEIVRCINDNKAKEIEREQDFELKEIEIREKREKLSEKDQKEIIKMKNERKTTFLPVEATAQALEEIFDRSVKDMERLMTEKDRAILIKKDDETIPLIAYREPEEYGEFIKTNDKEK